MATLFAATAAFGCRSELWCNSTNDGRLPRSGEVSTPDRIASIDDRSGASGSGVVAELGSEWLCHAAVRAPRSHGSRANMPGLRGADPRDCTIAARPREQGGGAARPALQSARSGQGVAGIDAGGDPCKGEVAPPRHAGRRRLVYRRGRGRHGVAALIARRDIDAPTDDAGTKRS